MRVGPLVAARPQGAAVQAPLGARRRSEGGVAVAFRLLAPQLLATQNAASVFAFLAVGFCLMGGLFGPCGAYLPELFPANVLYSGSGLAYNLSSILGGAFAPTIATALVLAFGIQGVGWYLLAMSVVALAPLVAALLGNAAVSKCPAFSDCLGPPNQSKNATLLLSCRFRSVREA